MPNLRHLVCVCVELAQKRLVFDLDFDLAEHMFQIPTLSRLRDQFLDFTEAY